ncbi:hypothetical protein DICVIV_04274 [Dictyocaulus viviparus]|uniref:Trafficking protein particle complex subunit 11 domain-containing protein n=1 Tax=Dictyocaulus viviparus TaxID=29172 RepID=A0A0D8Y0E1_DICVI|nr:hypothetical protein DICVIV_04274 [Dictyocaulus viviparus]
MIFSIALLDAGYAFKLQSALHELAQGFYQQKLKVIRSRSIPNNSPALVVRQLFKLAFLSELKQDTHTAYRNYRLAYEQCKDHIESWDDIDIFEWRSVVGLLNYKMCELCFLHNMAVEAISQMRRHQAVFFVGPSGTYPTPQLANIELQLWNAKQCWHFAQLFEQAVVNGLTALATLNPGTHLDLAASLYSSVNRNILALKKNCPVTKPYPVPDPMHNLCNTIFFGQRPWRIGYNGLAPANIEEDAVTAILHRLVVNSKGVITLLDAAMEQFKKYGCFRMYHKGIIQKGDVYYSSGDFSRALQFWISVVREGIPPAVRQGILRKAASAAYCVASIKDYVWCCVQMMSSSSVADDGFRAILNCIPPPHPFSQNEILPEQLAQYQLNWEKVFVERQYFSIPCSQLDLFVAVEASFLETNVVQPEAKVPIRLCLTSMATTAISFSAVVVECDVERRSRCVAMTDTTSLLQCSRRNIILEPQKRTFVVVLFDLSKCHVQRGQTLRVVISRVSLELGDRHSKIFGQLEFNLDITPSVLSRRFLSRIGLRVLRISALDGGLVADASTTHVDCLVAEIAEAIIVLRNTCGQQISGVRICIIGKMTCVDGKVEIIQEHQNSTTLIMMM